MEKFKKEKKALALVQSLRERQSDKDHPLCTFAREKHGNGKYTGSWEFAGAVGKAFKIATKNGYGADYLTDKNKEGEAKLNAFQALISAAEKDPASATKALKDYDQKSLSQLFYMINKRVAMDPRNLVSVVKGCLPALLERAVELGPYLKR